LLIDDYQAGPSWSINQDGSYLPATRLVIPHSNNETYDGNIKLLRDIDNDGLPDILFMRDYDDSQGLRWFTNDTPNSGKILNRSLITHNLSWVYEMNAGDFDQDGDMDLIAAYGRAYDGDGPYDDMLIVYAYLSDLDKYAIHSAERFHPQTDGSDPTYRANAHFLDIDEDNDLDILYQVNWELDWMMNLDGFVTFGPKQLISNNFVIQSGVFGILLDDLNGDGLLDIAGEDEIYLNNPNSPNFTLIDAHPNFNNYKWFQTIDFDGDGDRDLILSRNTSVIGASVCFNTDGSGLSWDQNTVGSPDIFGSAEDREFEVLDVDNDGDEDLIYKYVNGNTNLNWFENLGGGIFTTNATPISSFSLPNVLNNEGGKAVKEVYVEDFNSDGLPDLITGTNRQNLQFLFLNNPDAPFQDTPIQLAEDHLIWTVGVADLDLDGLPDVMAGDLSKRGNLVRIDNNWPTGPFDSPFALQYRVFIDANEDQQYDPQTEQIYPNASVNLVDQNTVGFTGNGGIGTFLLEDPGIYTLSLNLPPLFQQTTLPLEYEINTDTLNGQMYEFGVIAPDIEVFDGFLSYYHSAPVCSRPNNHSFYAYNTSTKPVDIWLKVHYSYAQSGPLSDPVFYPGQEPDSIDGSAYLWYFEAVPIGAIRLAQLLLPMPPLMPGQDQTFSWQLEGFYFDQEGSVWEGDLDFDYGITCSYDPNDKQVRPFRDSLSNYFVETDEEFEYLIRFQNTGTATAFDIR
ncbi:MAG: VCBS repeat-containing protein, partial [Phaeodactylibacter sp.]|nr:VCBS repeat-containing protein [Phaeodactylibacter sp.]